MHRQMRYFIAVVETNSFFKAGEICHISQSAISQQIKALENELQVQLLERNGRKFTVTPAGQYFYEQAKRQMAALDSLVREVRRIGKGRIPAAAGGRVEWLQQPDHSEDRSGFHVSTSICAAFPNHRHP